MKRHLSECVDTSGVFDDGAGPLSCCWQGEKYEGGFWSVDVIDGTAYTHFTEYSYESTR